MPDAERPVEAAGEDLAAAAATVDEPILEDDVAADAGDVPATGAESETAAGEPPETDAEDEKDLAVVEAGHLFPQHITWMGFRAGALLRGFTYDFIQLLAPHLTRDRIERILSASTPAAREKLISAIDVPRYD
jgi:hypothetical protein